MNFLIVGAGAVGSYFGGRMLQAGLRVTFFARGQRLQQLQQKGLQIQSIDGDLDWPNAPVTNQIHSQADVIFLCGKSYAMSSMLDAISPAVSSTTQIISLQNGLGNEEAIAAQYGQNRTVGGVAFIAATRDVEGKTHHTSAGKLTLGAWGSQSIDAIIQNLQTAQFTLTPTADIRLAIWQKLLWNVAFNPSCTLNRCSVDQLLADTAGETLVCSLMKEVIAIAHTQGITLSEHLIEKNLAVTRAMTGFNPSMYEDYLHNRKLEYDAILGHLLALAKQTDLNYPALTKTAEQLKIHI